MNDLEKLSNYFGFLGVLLFSSFAFLSITGAEIGMGMVLLALLTDKKGIHVLKRDPVFILFAVFFLYILCLTTWAIWMFPETQKVQIRDASAWLKLWYFICLAWWIKGDMKKIQLVLALSFAGFITGIVLHSMLHFDWSNLKLFYSLEAEAIYRTGFHLKKPLAFSLYCAVSVLGLIVLASRLYPLTSPLREEPPPPTSPLWGEARWGVFFFVAWLALILLLTEAIFLTKARSTWVAVAFVFPFALLARYGMKDLSIKKIAIAITCTVIIIVLFIFHFPNVKERFLEDKEALVAALSDTSQELPPSSLAYRINLYDFGVKKWLERPVFGWGPGSTRYLISKSGRPELMHPQWKGGQDWLDHLHNTYLAMLFRLGILGALILFSALFFILRSLWNAYRSGNLPRDYAIFFVSAFAITFIWCLTDFRALHYDWRNFWTLLSGASYSFALYNEKMGSTSSP